MFKLSRKGEYAIRTVFHLSVRRTMCTTLEIAETQSIPEEFLKKIINPLRTAGYIDSIKGNKGGLVLRSKPEEVSVRDIVESVEGPVNLNICLVEKKVCSRDEICPVHEMWVKCQKAVLEVLGSYNFKDLAERHIQLIGKFKMDNDGANGCPPMMLNLLPVAYK